MESTSNKIKVYSNGIVKDGIGAYAYIVLESLNCGEVELAGVKTNLFTRSILRARFAQAGKADDDTRMKMRAVYEGVRHCPDGAKVEIFSDNFLLKDILESTTPDREDGDIAERYRNYVFAHKIEPVFEVTRYYNGKDYPDNDHDEWTWYAHYLCENAIKKYKKENK